MKRLLHYLTSSRSNVFTLPTHSKYCSLIPNPQLPIPQNNEINCNDYICSPDSYFIYKLVG